MNQYENYNILSNFELDKLKNIDISNSVNL